METKGTSTSNGTAEPKRNLHGSNVVVSGDVAGGHRRSLSGNILSKLSFLGSSGDDQQGSAENQRSNSEFSPGDDRILPRKPTRAMAVAVQQQQTRRRKGSLRKAALLGRGAQREKKETRTFSLETSHNADTDTSSFSSEEISQSPSIVFNTNSRPPEAFSGRPGSSLLSPIKTLPMGTEDRILTSPMLVTSPTLSYTSTTDEDDILSIPLHNLPPSRVGPSGSDSYFPAGIGSLTGHRSVKKANSPLSVTGISSGPLPTSESEWDYSETEWWGWVLLLVTWIVFVTGMGSCLGVWSWAWDVGETPYAPPELEDDPTLPIVGYYPALIILSSVMAWVWVVVAWVGMKYFRHAKISGD